MGSDEDEAGHASEKEKLHRIFFVKQRSNGRTGREAHSASISSQEVFLEDNRNGYEAKIMVFLTGSQKGPILPVNAP